MPPHSQLDIPSLLHRIPLFSELSEADIQLVARYTRDRHIARGEMLFQRGDQPHGFYFVVSGQVKLAFTSADGNEKVDEFIVGNGSARLDVAVVMGMATVRSEA